MQQHMSENWISRDCHNETANEGKEASGADQLDTRDRSADYFTHEKSENLCLYLHRKKAENLSIFR